MWLNFRIPTVRVFSIRDEGHMYLKKKKWEMKIQNAHTQQRSSPLQNVSFWCLSETCSYVNHGESRPNLLQTLACQLYNPVISSWFYVQRRWRLEHHGDMSRSGGCRRRIYPSSELRSYINPAQTDEALSRFTWSGEVVPCVGQVRCHSCSDAVAVTDLDWAAALCFPSSPRAKGLSTKSSRELKLNLSTATPALCAS